jgi:hypothetical protein
MLTAKDLIVPWYMLWQCFYDDCRIRFELGFFFARPPAGIGPLSKTQVVGTSLRGNPINTGGQRPCRIRLMTAYTRATYLLHLIHMETQAGNPFQTNP